jgi:hypothetical protein
LVISTIPFTPKDKYFFKDHFNSLVIIAQHLDDTLILLSFPVTSSPAWPHQGLAPNPGMLNQLLHCKLPGFPSHVPCIGGTLHSCFYSAPYDSYVNHASRQPTYIPTTVFVHDGLPIAHLFTIVYVMGQVANHISGLGSPFASKGLNRWARTMFNNSIMLRVH